MARPGPPRSLPAAACKPRFQRHIARPDTRAITVVNPAPGGVVSNGVCVPIRGIAATVVMSNYNTLTVPGSAAVGDFNAAFGDFNDEGNIEVAVGQSNGGGGGPRSETNLEFERSPQSHSVSSVRCRPGQLVPKRNSRLVARDQFDCLVAQWQLETGAARGALS